MEKIHHPKDKWELKSLVIKLIREQGVNVNLNCIDTSAITDMSGLFSVPAYPTDDELLFIDFDGDISEWDVSNVTNMKRMFYYDSYLSDDTMLFNRDISKWNVSKVTDMGEMFHGCGKFNQNLNDWDVSNVVNMEFMFAYAHEFNGNISNWNVGNVLTMDSMFLEAYKFNCDISKWNVSNVRDFECMFDGALEFSCDITNWDVSKAKYVFSMFHGTPALKVDIQRMDWNKDADVNTLYSNYDEVNYYDSLGKEEYVNLPVKPNREPYPCIIRPATIEDAEFIGKCCAAGLFQQDENQIQRFAVRAKNEDTLYSYRNTLIAEIDGVPAACAISYEGNSFREMCLRTWGYDAKQALPGEYHFDTVATDQNFRGLGLATQLIEFVMEKANRECDFKYFTLVTEPNNYRAIGLYESLDFHRTGEKRCGNFIVLAKPRD